MKGHVGLLFPSFEGGGVCRVMTNLAKGLLENGYQVDLVVRNAAKNPFSQLHGTQEIIDLHQKSMLSSLPGLIRYLNEKKPDFLISAQMYVNLTAILACRLTKTNTRVVICEHNDVYSVYQHAETIKERAVPLLAKILYKWADSIVAISEEMAVNLSKWLGISGDRIRIILNPIITDQLATLAAEKPNHAWLQKGEPPVVLAVGRLEKQKDYPTLVKAFSEVVSNVPAKLLILGEGSQRFSIEELISALHLEDKVKLEGQVSNPYAYMSRAAVFVLSSAWEGYPTVLVEAMACGCQVVSTNCPTGPREILKGGKLGTLVPVGDVEALASAILSALGTPQKKNEYALGNEHSILVATKQYIQLLKELENS
jgi:glycosyltransferase involved in cell wall biosynthesis